MRPFLWLSLILLCLWVTACAHTAPPPRPAAAADEELDGRVSWIPLGRARAEQRDLERIRQIEVLRVLVQGVTHEVLPRAGSPMDRELALVEELARSRGWRLQLVVVPFRSSLIDALLDGRGDVLAARFTNTPSRAARVLFSQPVRTVDELVVGAAGAKDLPRSRDDLGGREVHVRASSSFVETFLTEQQTFKRPVSLLPLAEDLDDDDALWSVGQGRYGLTVADSDAVKSYLTYRQDIEVGFALKKSAQIAWAVHPKNTALVGDLNRFLQRAAVPTDPSVEGLAGVRARGVLRVLMPNEPSSYFYFRGHPVGFQYTLSSRLARSLGVRLQPVVPRSPSHAMELLLTGHADAIAPILTVTRGRKEHVAFSSPMYHASELLVQHRDAPPIFETEQLKGKTVTVRKSSSYHETLSRLAATVDGLTIAAAPENQSTSQLIERVASGELAMTVADANILTAHLVLRQPVVGALTLGTARPVAFAVPSGQEALLDAINAFVMREREREGLDPRDPIGRGRVRREIAWEDVPQEAPTHIARVVYEAADKYALQAKILVAMIKLESRFDAGRIGWLGEKGLLQVMPHVAKRLGFDPNRLGEVDPGVLAGAARLAELAARFKTVDSGLRTRLSLAAWRVGHGHVAEAVRSAKGGDWPSIEKALIALETPDVAAGSRLGYCPGREAVRYVKRVFELAGYKE